MVAENVLRRLEPLKGSVIPADVQLAVTRNYGETAAEKSNELLFHMLIAVVSVSILIAITLGLRESLIVFIAIPVTLALTLAVFYLYGYTLNRITLFALIFSIGILVDDAIVVVENIVRHWRMPANRERPPLRRGDRSGGRSGQPDHPRHAHRDRGHPAHGVRGRADGAVHAADPDRRDRGHDLLAHRGLHGDALGRRAHAQAPAARTARAEREDRLTRLYRRVMGALLHKPALRWGFLGGVVVLLLGSVALFYIEFVKVKMLPFDNKSEFQVIVDMPEGTTLEQTARVTEALARAGHEAARSGEPADLRGHGLAVQLQRPGAPLLPAQRRERGRHPGEPAAQARPQAQSHEIAKQVRNRLLPVAERYGARIKVAEVPPGPPVLQTLVAEVYGPTQQGQHGPRAPHPRPLQAHRRRGGRGLVRGRRPAQVPARWWTRRRPR